MGFKRLLKSGLSWLLGANFGGAKVFSSESLSLPGLPELSSLSTVSSSVVLSFGCNSGGNKSKNLDNDGSLVCSAGPKGGGPSIPTSVLFLTLLLGGFPLAIRQSSQSQTFGLFSGGGFKQE